MNNGCQTYFPSAITECAKSFSRSGSFEIVKAKDMPTSFLLAIIEGYRESGGHIVLERCPFDFNAGEILEYNYFIILDTLRFEVDIKFL